VQFNPKSPKAIQGMKFQDEVLHALAQIFAEVIPVRDYLLAIDPYLSSQQLNFLEQTFGDIVVMVSPKDPVFVECVSLGGEHSRFPESKVKKFTGDNKFYAFGWDGGETKYIPSITWNAYARKLELFFQSGREFRRFSRRHITSIRKSCTGSCQFKALLEMYI